MNQRKKKSSFLLFLFPVIILLLAFNMNSIKDVQADNSLLFSGYEWNIKDSTGTEEKWGPGPNVWNGSPESVWVDSNGYLHLKIRNVDGIWQCAEIYSKESFGYGEYLFQLSPGFENLDVNIVLGLFVYYNDTQEIDIEFARWGYEESTNSQYALQPASKKNNLYLFDTEIKEISSTHSFIWSEECIQFSSGSGNTTDFQENIYSKWTYKGADNPIPKTERVHLNFWLMSGLDPINLQEAEIIVEKFEFLPLDTDFQCQKQFINGYSGLGILFLSINSIIGIIWKISQKRILNAKMLRP